MVPGLFRPIDATSFAISFFYGTFDQEFLGIIGKVWDHRADYFVQASWMDTEDIFGVELKTFSDHYYAVDWLNR